MDHPIMGSTSGGEFVVKKQAIFSKDTYWIVRGLLLSGMNATARGGAQCDLQCDLQGQKPSRVFDDVFLFLIF